MACLFSICASHMISRYNIPGGVTQNSKRKEKNIMDAVVKIIGLLVAAVAVTVFFGLLFSLPVMLLWNACLVAAIPGVKEIGWLQAWGILILCGLLFKPASATKE